MMKRLILLTAVLLTGILLLCISFSAFAQDDTKWLYTISANGEYAVIEHYEAESARAVIPDTLGGRTVKEIAADAFEGCDRITELVIPASVTKIGDLSFSALSNLEKITVAEDSVSFRDLDGVLYQKKLTTVYCYPQGRNEDGYVLPDSVKTIGAKAFYRSRLKTITIPEKVTKIQTGAFCGCAELTDIVLGEKVSMLFDEVFKDCAALEKVILPDSLTSIGADCFAGCAALREIEVPEKVSSLGAGAFSQCTALESAEIKSKYVRKIESRTFDGCVSLEHIAFSANLLSIGQYAFRDCRSLTGFPIKEGISVIGRGAFMGCAKLVDIIIPASVTTVEADAFSSSAWLNEKNETFVIVCDGILIDVKSSDESVQVPDNVRMIAGMSKTARYVAVPEGVVRIAAGAFADCGKLETVTLPASLQSIGDCAFENCGALKAIDLPAGVNAIGNNAFRNCEQLEKINVAAANTTFVSDKGVLYNKIKRELICFPINAPMTEYKVGISIHAIGAEAVRANKNLTVLDASASGLSELGQYAFADCEKLLDVVLPSTVKSIGAHCFENCAVLGTDKMFNIPDSVTVIDDYAFRNCVSFTGFSVNTDLVQLGKGVFEGLDNYNMTGYSYLNDAEYLLMYNFYGYPRNGVKRAVLRKMDTNAPLTGAPVCWWLVNEAGEAVLSGPAAEEPDTFGMHVYTCDFTEAKETGNYALYIDFEDETQIYSGTIRIDDTPYMNTLLKKLSFGAAHARYAAGTKDGGFYDCNSQMGEAYSHGVFLKGLCKFEETEGRYLDESELSALQWSEQVAFDYLMRLQDPETGEIINCAPERPSDSGNMGIHDTYDALMGLCAYVSKNDDPQRTTGEVKARLEKSMSYLERYMSANHLTPSAYAYQDWYILAELYVYRATGKETYLDDAEQRLVSILDLIQIHTLPGGWSSVPVFEAMWIVGQERPEIKELPAWKECLERVQKGYVNMMQNNAFDLLPQNDGTMPLLNNGILLWGINNCYLALLTENDLFYEAAAAAVDFPCGINWGVPGDQLARGTENGIAAASFFANTAESARPWSSWYFAMRTNDWVSIENGYEMKNGRPDYTDTKWETGETFIKTDGMFLYLASLYETLTSQQ